MDVPGWLAAVVVMIGMPAAIYGAVFVLAMRKALRERRDEQAKIDRRLAAAAGIPRQAVRKYRDVMRDLDEREDARTAELNARFGPDRKGAA